MGEQGDLFSAPTPLSVMREHVRSICQSLPTRSISGVRLDIDAAMRP